MELQEGTPEAPAPLRPREDTAGSRACERGAASPDTDSVGARILA